MIRTEQTDKKETLVDLLCKNIRMDIITQQFQPGQRLRTKELAVKYGTSETPVKLALNRLMNEQVVESFPRQGTRVRSISEEDAKETFSIRLMMDLFFVKEIIESVSMNQQLREALQNNVDAHYQAVQSAQDHTDVELFLLNYKYDYEFHELYLKCSGNKKIVEIYRNINLFLYTNYIFRKQSEERDLASVREHQGILQAILSKDEELLREKVTEHMNNSVNAICKILRIERML